MLCTDNSDLKVGTWPSEGSETQQLGRPREARGRAMEREHIPDGFELLGRRRIEGN